MKVVVGLGNPGEKYKNNRHNAGFMVVDKLVGSEAAWVESKKFFGEIIEKEEVIYLKPTTFMNDSGKAVSAIKRFYKVKNEDLYIVHDDLDIALGNYKIQHGKGPQIHNGLKSIEEQLGTDKFWNVRIGVENREIRGNKGIPGVEYSLQNFTPNEVEIIGNIIETAAKDLLTRLT